MLRFSTLLLASASAHALIAAPAVRCDALLRSLFVEPATVQPATIAAACSPSVEWLDMDRSEPVRGPAAVQALLEDKFPEGSRLAVERLADGATSGGFAWHREAEGVDGSGLRGITYVELDGDGKIAFVQEGAEPLFKLDKLLEALLKATAKNLEKEAEVSAPQDSTTAWPHAACRLATRRPRLRFHHEGRACYRARRRSRLRPLSGLSPRRRRALPSTCGRWRTQAAAAGSKMPSTLLEGGAPSASRDHLKARAAATHPRAPPEQLGGWPWPQ